MTTAAGGGDQLRPGGYGTTVDLAPTRGVEWYPLAHPGAVRREPWKSVHDTWMAGTENH